MMHCRTIHSPIPEWGPPTIQCLVQWPSALPNQPPSARTLAARCRGVAAQDICLSLSQGCPKLEELVLEDNHITKLEGLSSLLHLRRFEIGKNKISRIEGLDGNHYLSQISLEDNEITSLDGLGMARLCMPPPAF